MSVLDTLAQRLGWFWDKPGAKGIIFRYGLATLFVLLAFVLRLSQNEVLRDRVLFTFFITSALMSATLAGFRAGIYALVLGWLLADYFFAPPFRSFGSYGKVETVTLISELVPSFLGITLIELLHRTRRLANAEIEKRKKIEADLIEARKQLEIHAKDLERRVHERTSELENGVRFLEGFCYSIAHDLRAPLRGIQGMVQALQEDYRDKLGEGGAEYARRIVEASQKMDKLVLDLLDFGRLSHEKLSFELVSVDAQLDDVLLSLKEQIRGPEITVKRPLGQIWADARLVRLILFHLVINALKFRQATERLRIDVWAEDRERFRRFWIRDNGIGIDPQHQGRIFRLFETLQPSTASSTGAGLALVAKALERMHGSIGVHSEPGKGSSFWFDLPRK